MEFLAHGLAEVVAFAASETCEETREEHHLLLIDGDAVSVLEIRLHDGDVVFDFFAALFAVDEVGNFVHRPRAVEGIHGNEVLECLWVEVAEVGLHSGRLELECACRAAFAVELISFLVVERYIVDVNVNTP